MNRRTFLHCLKITGLSGIIPGGLRQIEAGERRKKRVIVIGAGLAGLAAAKKLSENHIDVVILEGRHRIGGRVLTSRKWSQIPIDLGAGWIHGIEGNPISDYAYKIKANLIPTSYEHSEYFDKNGLIRNNPELEQISQLIQSVKSTIRQAQSTDTDKSLRQTLRPLFAENTDDPKFIRNLEFVLNSEYEHEYSGSSDQLSTHWHDSDESFNGKDVIFKDGYSGITDFLSRGLQIRQGHIVKNIRWDKPQVSVYTDRGEYMADQVIVTLPLGVLKKAKVTFSPTLPAEKLDAISKIGMGTLNKCCLLFDKVFWPSDADWLEYISDRKGEWAEWLSLKHSGGWPVLVGFNAADRGLEIEKLSDHETVESAVKALQKMFGNKVTGVVDYQITRWASDLFSHGSYSFNAVGAGPQARELLAQPVGGRLFFAGEAASKDYFGTTHGAYLSGTAAAEEVLRN